MKAVLVMFILLLTGCEEITITPKQMIHIQDKAKELCPTGTDSIMLLAETQKALHFTLYCTNNLKGTYPLPKGE